MHLEDTLPCRLLEADTSAVVGDVLVEDIGIELAGQEFGLFLAQGAVVPCSAAKIFTTADKDQTSIEIHFMRRRGPGTPIVSIGRFEVCSIPAAPAGEPKIEITIDIYDRDIWVRANDVLGGGLSLHCLVW